MGASVTVHPTPSPKVKQKVEQYLRSNSPAFVALLNWNIRYKYWKLQNSNQQVIYTGELYGKNAAAAHYILTNEGAVRFKGHTQWYQHKGGRFSWDFLQHKDLPVECVDLSGSTVDYLCLSNIVSLHDLRYLNLSRCPYIDDWALSRLHAFQDSLEVLSLAGCPRVTERGLATLHHLQHLKHLDLTDLPSVNNKGLIRILLEEVIPACEIVGIEYTDGLETGEVRAPEMTRNLEVEPQPVPRQLAFPRSQLAIRSLPRSMRVLIRPRSVAFEPAPPPWEFYLRKSKPPPVH